MKYNVTKQGEGAEFFAPSPPIDPSLYYKTIGVTDVGSYFSNKATSLCFRFIIIIVKISDSVKYLFC